jgi:hypothetical protein
MSHEVKDASVEVIGIGAGLLVLMVLLSIGVSAWMYHARYAGSAFASAGHNGSFTHGPDEKLGIAVDYAAVMRSAQEHLEHYGWVDPKAGIARIPIERAMELVVAGKKPAAAPKEPGQVP